MKLSIEISEEDYKELKKPSFVEGEGNLLNRTLVAERLINAVRSGKSEEATGVVKWGDGYSEGMMVYDFAECPSCGYSYEEGDKDWEEPFCPHCGKALNWFEYEEEEGDTE